MKSKIFKLLFVCVFIFTAFLLNSCNKSKQANKEIVYSNSENNEQNNEQNNQNLEVNNNLNNNQSNINTEIPDVNSEETPFFIRNQISEFLSGLIRIKVDTNNYEDCIDSSRLFKQDGSEHVRVYRIHNIQQYDAISDYVTYSNNLSFSNNIYPFYLDDTEGFTDEMLASLELSDSLITTMAVTTKDADIFTKFDEYIVLGKLNFMPLDGGSFNSSEIDQQYNMLDYTTKDLSLLQSTKYSSFLLIPIKDGKISFKGLSEQQILEYSSVSRDNLFQFNPYLEEEYRLKEGDTLEDIERWYIELTKLVANSPVQYGKDSIKYDDGTVYHKVYMYDIIDGEKVLNKEKFFYAYIYEGWKLQILNDDLYIIKGYNDTIYIETLNEKNQYEKLYLYSDIFS